MKNIIYNNYVTNNILLVKSFVIKSHTIAVHMNKYLKEYGVEYDKEDMSTWAYYLNLSGKKHSANTDIFIRTLEDNELILLDADTLELYPKTKKELLLFGDLFSSLIKEYSGQEIYIRGILTPIDMNLLLTSKEGTILYYNKALVEDNETNLIPYLSSAIGRFIERWSIPKYILVDELYSSALYSSIISFTIKRLFVQRLNAITTSEVHSYYQDLILLSKLNITEHKNILNLKSILWLINNIDYINSNIGQDHTFRSIIDNVLMPSGVSVDEINILPTQVSKVTVGGIPTYVKDSNTLYRVSNIDNDIKYESVELSDIIDKLIYEDELNYFMGSSSVRFKDLKDKVINTVGISERTNVYILKKLTVNLNVLELYGDEILCSLIDTIYKTPNFSILDKGDNAITLTSSEVLNMIIKLSNIEYSSSSSNIKIRVFENKNINVSEVTTNEDRIVEYQSLLSIIDELFNSNISELGKQLEIHYIFDNYEANSFNGIANAELQYIKKKLLTDKLIPFSTDSKTYDNFDIDIVFSELYKYSNVELDDNSKLLEKIKMLLGKLTSYNVTSIVDDRDFTNILPIEPAMVMYDENIIVLEEVEYECLGDIAIVNGQGSDVSNSIVVWNTKVLTSKTLDSLLPQINVSEISNTPRILISKPIISSI